VFVTAFFAWVENSLSLGQFLDRGRWWLRLRTRPISSFLDVVTLFWRRELSRQAVHVGLTVRKCFLVNFIY